MICGRRSIHWRRDGGYRRGWGGRTQCPWGAAGTFGRRCGRWKPRRRRGGRPWWDQRGRPVRRPPLPWGLPPPPRRLLRPPPGGGGRCPRSSPGGGGRRKPRRARPRVRSRGPLRGLALRQRRQPLGQLRGRQPQQEGQLRLQRGLPHLQGRQEPHRLRERPGQPRPQQLQPRLLRRRPGRTPRQCPAARPWPSARPPRSVSPPNPAPVWRPWSSIPS
mmetsp:Transcript_16895/g.48790  ORF Transcript_16895/g.48790 Transcript_16895/m.48790 type:complete len:218 (-) Transcript_16895:825-1478(-)